MPRKARVKTNESVYHVMCKSISERRLLNDEDDKLKYIQIIREYMKLHKFRIYGYCFMDTHLHLIIDSNGADISQIMHGINRSYAHYYNAKYERSGHLFQDRFNSKIIDTNRYLVAASAYIHNNPTDIEGYQNCPEKYKFSSLAVYLGIKKDEFGLVNTNFVLALLGENIKKARERYYELVFKCDIGEKKGIEFEDEGTFYASQRVILARNVSIDEIIDYVSLKMETPKMVFHMKYNRSFTKAKALLVVLLKNLCNYRSASICAILGNITQSNVSQLTRRGLELMKESCDFNSYFEGYLISKNA